jgi:hypothetical protein
MTLKKLFMLKEASVPDGAVQMPYSGEPDTDVATGKAQFNSEPMHSDAKKNMERDEGQYVRLTPDEWSLVTVSLLTLAVQTNNERRKTALNDVVNKINQSLDKNLK